MKLIELLEKHSYSINLEANDFFDYACADTVSLELMDLPKYHEIINKYGIDGHSAFLVKIKEVNPIKPHINSNYKKALKELESYILYEYNDNEKEWDNYHKAFVEYKNNQ